MIIRFVPFFIVLILFSCNGSLENCQTGNCDNGWGRVEEKDGSYYEGNFKGGVYHGYGIYYNIQKDILFKGNWKNGELVGYVELAYGDDSESPQAYFKGHWNKGIENGYGEMYWGYDPYFPEQLYKGYWKNGHLDGYGIYDWADGSVYKGYLKKGDREGFGEMVWTDSLGTDIYKGYWSKDKMHGYGEYRWADGSYYKGPWDMNNQQGHGVYFDAEGVRWEGVWQDGICNEIPDFKASDPVGQVLE